MERLAAAITATGTSAVLFGLLPQEWNNYLQDRGAWAIVAFAAFFGIYKLFLHFVKSKDDQVKAAERREMDISSILDTERTEARKERREQHEKMVVTLTSLADSVNRLTNTVEQDIAVRRSTG